MKSPLIYHLSLVVIMLFLVSCGDDKDDPVPSTLAQVTTLAASEITSDSVKLSGIVVLEGSSAVVQRGFCWSLMPAPTVSGASSLNASGPGAFSHELGGLDSDTRYYVRAYAVNGGGISYGNEISFKTKLKVGDTGPAGGLVFYVDSTGSGMELAPASTEVQVIWGCYGTLISGTSAAIGTGQANTTQYMNVCGQNYTAAYVCDTMTFGGYNDWYLPSKDELHLVYTNIKVPGLDVFQGGSYWSSTEQTATHAWRENLGAGIQATNPKIDSWWVRAVRSF